MFFRTDIAESTNNRKQKCLCLYVNLQQKTSQKQLSVRALAMADNQHVCTQSEFCYDIATVI